MGRPLRCIQQPSPFISFSNILNTSTSTTSAPSTTSDPISQYINIPISGYPCPSNFSVTTSTTSTTLSPLVITNNINNCTLYSFIFESQEIELDFDCVSPTPNSNSAIVRYQPCQSGVFVNELIYNNKDLCVAGTVGNNIRILSGHGNLAKIGSCNNNITTTTTATTSTTPTTSTTIAPQPSMPFISLNIDSPYEYGDININTAAYGDDADPNTLDSIPALKNAGYINQLRTEFVIDLQYKVASEPTTWNSLLYGGFGSTLFSLKLSCPYGCANLWTLREYFSIGITYNVRIRLQAIDDTLAGPWTEVLFINYSITE
jgi:hypothetical protein